MQKPLMRKVDCVQFYVPDLAAGVAFYCGQLGHTVAWRTAEAVGLRLPDTDAEIVLRTDPRPMEVDFLVASAEEAARQFAAAGGQVVVPPFDIQIGRCVVVADPWGNELVLLDTSKGLLETDAAGNVLGNLPPDPIAA